MRGVFKGFSLSGGRLVECADARLGFHLDLNRLCMRWGGGMENDCGYVCGGLMNMAKVHVIERIFT